MAYLVCDFMHDGLCDDICVKLVCMRMCWS